MKINNKFKKIFFYGTSSALVLSAALLLMFVYFFKTLPPIESIMSRQVTQSTKIYDRTGEVLLYEIAQEQKRTIIPLSEVPQFIQDATIAIEDEKFYEEGGFSVRGIIRAFFANLTSGEIVQGGSTITQQLAKNAFLTQEQTIQRKIRELILARELTKRYTKNEILELYLNEVPYGSNLYGIEAASRAYFGKSARDINLAEAATLAALTRAPSYYSPWGSHPEELFSRQHFVLEKMRRLQMIDDEQLESSKNTKIVFLPQTRGMRAPHFVFMVQEYLASIYGEDLVQRGGLRVVTTLDLELQTLAEKAVLKGAERNEELYGGTNAALVAEDTNTGQILALVGSRDYFDVTHEGNFNVATQGLRQPGSALKPFAYLTAFSAGFTSETIVFDTPTEFAANSSKCPAAVNFFNEDDSCFHPQNFDEQFRGPVSFRNALAQSINVPAVKVLYLAGLNETLKTLSDFGITTLKDPQRYGLSLVLGGGEVRLAELVGAYATFAEEGARHNQKIILEVKDGSNRVLESYRDEHTQVAPKNYVQIVNDILSDVEARSGLLHTSLPLTIFSGHEVALKTGTTNDYRDAWAIGYTPSFVVGVWAGNNDNTPMKARGSSILAAIPMWSEFMGDAIKKMPQETFIRPEPRAVSKPILRGDYTADNQVHTILYYVDPKNPQGAPPINPATDPQFYNWEYGVLQWARANIAGFDTQYNEHATGVPQGGYGANVLRVEFIEPKSGIFVEKNIDIRAHIISSAGLTKIMVRFNNNLVQEFSGTFGSSYELRWLFTPSMFLPQNVLVIEAVDALNNSKSESIIVYK